MQKFGLAVEQPAQIQKAPINIKWQQILFRILPHRFHSLLGQLNKGTNFLQVSPREIKNLKAGGTTRSRGAGKFFKRNKRGDWYNVYFSVPLLLCFMIK